MELLLNPNPWIITLILLWTLPWKGYALWKAARADERNWFIVILILNTLAILDILYIFFFSNREAETFAESDSNQKTSEIDQK
jgi:Family of unknown function (DUF5652)